MEMSVKLNVEKTESGQTFFEVYRVFGVKQDGNKVTLHCFANRKVALDYVRFAKETFSELYKVVFEFSELVWCNEL